MLPGPILRREMRAATAGRGWFVLRCLLGLAIGGCAVAPGLTLGWSDSQDGYRPESVREYAAFVLSTAIAIVVVTLAPLAAASAGASIAEERERDTLSLLLLTRLTRLELALTKMAGRLAPVLLLAFAGLPFLMVAGWWAGLTPMLGVEIAAALTGALAVSAAFGILASARRDRQSSGRLEGIVWTLFWLVGLPLATKLPASSGTLWGDLLVEIRRLCAWIAPSSPLSLVTDNAWLASRAGMADALSDRLLLMAALQVVMVAVILGGVVASLRLREPHAREWDAFGGYRPPVGDDPIYWREYLLPLRGARRLAVWVYLRHLAILLRAVILMAVQAGVILMLLSIMVGVTVGGVYLGWRAFQEAWLGRRFPGGPYEARDAMNNFIRCVTFFIGLSPAAATPATLVSQVVLERDKKTWESLLTTPLTGPEILGAKMRVGARNLWQAWRWLIPLWALGVVCDALHPAGFVAALAGLAAVSALGMGLGGRTSLKPGASSQSANSQAALWMIAMMALGSATILAPLCSARQLQTFWTQTPGRPATKVGLLAIAPALIVASAVAARALIRRNFERFDERVGRPRRAASQPPEALGPGTQRAGRIVGWPIGWRLRRPPSTTS